MKLKEWLNKLITHNRDTAGDFGVRVVIHIPIGFLMGIPVLGWGLIPLFIFYQKSEDRWVSDQAWKDVFGALVGFVIAMLMIASFLLLRH